jgi:drug/metabolite transporter (DMT)-like permease
MKESLSMHGRHWAGFAAIALIWGTTWLAVRVVVLEMPPLSAAGLRFVVAAVLLGVATRASGRTLSLARLSGGERRVLAWLTFLVIGIPYALVFYGERTVASALAAILFPSIPLSSCCSIRCASGGPLSGPDLRRAGAGFRGNLHHLRAAAGGPKGELLGALAIVVAALSAGIGAVIAKYGAHELDPWVGVTWQMAGAGVALLLAGLLFERPG